MTEPSFEGRVLDGFAAVAVAEGLRVPLAYDPSGEPYPAGVIGVYLDLTPDTREGSVTLVDYVVSDAFGMSDSIIGVQATIRHPDRATVKQIASDLFEAFDSRPACKLGDITLISAKRASGTNVGQDSNGRVGRIENFYLTVHRPSTNRT